VCSTFRTDRLLRVLAVQLTFERSGLGAFDELKLLVWRYLDQPILWQFQANSGWQDCDAVTQRTLQEADAQQVSVVTLRVRNWEYEYSIVAMTQTNRSSRKTRLLRRMNPYALNCALPGALEGAVVQPADPPLPLWQFSTGFGWSDFDDDIQGLLREAEARGDAVVSIPMREWDYEIDLVNGTQTNNGTGRVRNLRRLPPLPVEEHGQSHSLLIGCEPPHRPLAWPRSHPQNP